MSKINYEVNGVKHLLFEIEVLEYSKAVSFENKSFKYGGFVQSFKKVGFWKTRLRLRALIPETKAHSFAHDNS